MFVMNLLLAFVALFSSAHGGLLAGTCYNITIPVTVSSNKMLVLPENAGLADFANVFNSSIVPGPDYTGTASGTFNIGATYCEPELFLGLLSPHYNTLQVLVHGVTYTRSCKSSSF
jgi:hypothetical protein